MNANLSKLIRKIEASVIRQEDVGLAMQNQLSRIKVRTSLGRDVNGFPFLRKKDGSPSYLYRTGNLLRSLQSSVEEGARGLEGRVTVTGRAREYAPIVNQARRFMGASTSDRSAMVGDMQQSIRDRRSNA